MLQAVLGGAGFVTDPYQKNPIGGHLVWQLCCSDLSNGRQWRLLPGLSVHHVGLYHY